MSGASRALSSTPVSNFRCAAFVPAFSKISARFPRVCLNTSTDSACIRTFMPLASQSHSVGEVGAVYPGLAGAPWQ
jgi:hypothetical protein